MDFNGFTLFFFKKNKYSELPSLIYCFANAPFLAGKIL